MPHSMSLQAEVLEIHLSYSQGKKQTTLINNIKKPHSEIQLKKDKLRTLTTQLDMLLTQTTEKQLDIDSEFKRGLKFIVEQGHPTHRFFDNHEDIPKKLENIREFIERVLLKCQKSHWTFKQNANDLLSDLIKLYEEDKRFFHENGQCQWTYTHRASVHIINVGYYSIDLTRAYDLLCIDEKGNQVKKNVSGQHAVYTDGVAYYKPKSLTLIADKKPNEIQPIRETAASGIIHSFSEDAAVFSLLMIIEIPKRGSIPLQVSLTIHGDCLKEFIALREALKVWKKYLGGETLMGLLQDCCNHYKNALQRLTEKFSQIDLGLNLESSPREPNNQIIPDKYLPILLEVLEAIQSNDKVHPLFIDIKELLSRPIDNHLVSLRGLLTPYVQEKKDLTPIHAFMGVVLQFPELIAGHTLIERLEEFLAISHFSEYLREDIGLEKLVEQLIQSEHADFLDHKASSGLSIGIALAQANDGKFENFKREGVVQRARVVSIDNDDSFKMPFRHVGNQLCLEMRNSLIWLPELRYQTVHPEMRQKLLDSPADAQWLRWLSIVARNSSACQELGEQETLSYNDLREIGIPFELEEEYLTFIRNQWRKEQCLIGNYPDITHEQRFKALYPVVFSIYEKILNETDYSHYLIAARGEPPLEIMKNGKKTIYRKRRGFYLYRDNSSENLFVLVIHTNKNHEIIDLAQCISNDSQELHSLKWPEVDDCKAYFSEKLTELIKQNCQYLRIPSILKAEEDLYRYFEMGDCTLQKFFSEEELLQPQPYDLYGCSIEVIACEPNDIQKALVKQGEKIFLIKKEQMWYLALFLFEQKTYGEVPIGEGKFHMESGEIINLERKKKIFELAKKYGGVRPSLYDLALQQCASIEAGNTKVNVSNRVLEELQNIDWTNIPEEKQWDYVFAFSILAKTTCQDWQGCNKEYDLRTARQRWLMEAVTREEPQPYVALQMLNLGANVSQYEKTPLHELCARYLTYSKPKFAIKVAEVLLEDSTCQPDQYNSEGNTALHALVKSIQKANNLQEPQLEAIENLFELLLKYVYSEAKDVENNDTALDIILCYKKTPRLFCKLIALGAGKHADGKLVIAFLNRFSSNEHVKNAVSHLEKYNIDVKWQRSKMVALFQDNAHKGARIHAMSELDKNVYQLPKEISDKVSTVVHRNRIKTSVLGEDKRNSTHAVSSINYRTKEGNLIEWHIKSCPSMSGIQYAILSFSKRLFGHYKAPGELFGFESTEKYQAPAWFSQTVEGRSVKSIFVGKRYARYPIDLQSFCEHAILMILLRPGDALGKNIFLTKLGSIIDIDFDNHFVEPLNSRRELQLLAVLFVFSDMHNSIPAYSRQRICALNSVKFLKDWLRDCENFETLVNTQYDDKTRKFFLTQNMDNNVILNIRFDRRTITELVETLMQMGKILNEQPTITVMQLLKRLLPGIAHSCEESFKNFPSPHQVPERFRYISEKIYSVDPTKGYISKRNFHGNSALKEGHLLTPKQAMDWLDLIVEEKNQLDHIMLELMQGSFEKFINLSSEKIKQDLINQFDFSKVSEENQKKFVRIIIDCKIPFTELCIRNCACLSDKEIESILKFSSDLNSINLTNCPKITQKTIQFLSANHGYTLESLTFKQIVQLKEVKGEFLIAERMIFDENLQLNGIQIIAPLLQQCKITKHGELQTLSLKSPSLQYLDLSYSSKLSDVELNKILQNCIKLPRLILTGCISVTSMFLHCISKNNNKLFLEFTPKEWKILQDNYGCLLIETEVNLVSTKVESKEVGVIAALLIANKNLTRLKLSGLNIGDEGAKVLASALSQNSVLYVLDLSCNHIHSSGAQALLRALDTNRSLFKLILDLNIIPDELIQQISEKVSRGAMGINSLLSKSVRKSLSFDVVREYNEILNLTRDIPIKRESWSTLIMRIYNSLDFQTIQWKQQRNLPERSKALSEYDGSPDITRILSNGLMVWAHSNKIVLYDMHSSKSNKRFLTGHNSPVTHIVESKAKNVLLTGDKNGMIHVWMIKENYRLSKRYFSRPGCSVTAFSLLQDIDTLIVGYSDGNIILWDWRRAKQLSSLSKAPTCELAELNVDRKAKGFLNHTDLSKTVAKLTQDINPRAKGFLSYLEDEPESNREPENFKPADFGHSGSVHTLHSPAKGVLVSLSMEGKWEKLIFWNFAEQKVLNAYKISPNCFVQLENNHFAIGFDKTIRILSQRGEVLEEVTIENSVYRLSLINKKTLAILSTQGSIQLWDFNDRAIIDEICTNDSCPTFLLQMSNDILAVSFENGQLQYIDMCTKQLLKTEQLDAIINKIILLQQGDMLCFTNNNTCEKYTLGDDYEQRFDISWRDQYKPELRLDNENKMVTVALASKDVCFLVQTKKLFTGVLKHCDRNRSHLFNNEIQDDQKLLIFCPSLSDAENVYACLQAFFYTNPEPDHDFLHKRDESSVDSDHDQSDRKKVSQRKSTSLRRDFVDEEEAKMLSDGPSSSFSIRPLMSFPGKLSPKLKRTLSGEGSLKKLLLQDGGRFSRDSKKGDKHADDSSSSPSSSSPSGSFTRP